MKKINICQEFNINQSNIVVNATKKEEQRLEDYLNNNKHLNEEVIFVKTSYFKIMKNFMKIYKSMIEASKNKGLEINEIDEKIFLLKQDLLLYFDSQQKLEDLGKKIWETSIEKSKEQLNTFNQLFYLVFNSYLTCQFLKTLYIKYESIETRKLILQKFSIDEIKEESRLIASGDIDKLIFDSNFNLLPDLFNMFYNNNEILVDKNIFVQYIISGMEMCFDYNDFITFNNLMNNMRTHSHLSTINQGTFGTFDFGLDRKLDNRHDYKFIICKNIK